MICDKSLQLASGQGSITSPAVYSENWIDLSAAAKKLADAPVWCIVRVGTAFANGTNMTFELESTNTVPSDVAGSGIGNESVAVSSGAIATASLTTNTIVWKVKIPDYFLYRYVGMKMTPSGTFNAGTVDIEFVTDIPRS